jgi:hypothetical protein
VKLLSALHLDKPTRAASSKPNANIRSSNSHTANRSSLPLRLQVGTTATAFADAVGGDLTSASSADLVQYLA